MLSIIIPCYNEENVVRKTVDHLLCLIRQWLSEDLFKSYEIIFVDDGSKDNTLSILKELSRENHHLKIIAFSKNFGHQAALTAGLLHAAGDAAVTIDADLQDPPGVIKEMIEKYKKGCQIVYGVRRERHGDTFFKKYSALIFYKIMIFMGVNLVYNHADFRLLSRTVLDQFNRFQEVNRFIRGMIPMMGFDQAIVQYDRDKRHAGYSKYPTKKMISFAVEGITSFSSVPLRIAAALGFTIFSGTTLFILWAFWERLAGNTIPGWASTVLPIYFLGGIQLMFFGIIGEYIGKIYMEVKKRPLFFIKEKYNLYESDDKHNTELRLHT